MDILTTVLEPRPNGLGCGLNGDKNLRNQYLNFLIIFLTINPNTHCQFPLWEGNGYDKKSNKQLKFFLANKQLKFLIRSLLKKMKMLMIQNKSLGSSKYTETKEEYNIRETCVQHKDAGGGRNN